MNSLWIRSGVSCGDLLDLDAALLADHQHRLLAGAIEDDAEVELAFDLQALLDEDALDHLPSGRSGR